MVGVLPVVVVVGAGGVLVRLGLVGNELKVACVSFELRPNAAAPGSAFKSLEASLWAVGGRNAACGSISAGVSVAAV